MRLPLLILAAALVQEPARTPIAWALKKGEKVRYESSHRVVTGMLERTSSIDLTMWLSLEAGDRKDDGSASVRITFERLALANTGTAKEDYDSARDKEPPAASYPRVLSKLVNKSLAVAMKPTGQSEGLDGARALLQEAVDAWPDLKGRSQWDNEPTGTKARTLAWLIRTGLETPKGSPAAVGDSWEARYDGADVNLRGSSGVCRGRVKS